MSPDTPAYVAAIQDEAAHRRGTETFGLWPPAGAMLCLCPVALASRHEMGDAGMHLTDPGDAARMRTDFHRAVQESGAVAAVFDFSWVALVCRDFADELVGEFYQQVSDSGFDPVRAMRLTYMNSAVREVVMGVLRDRNLP